MISKKKFNTFIGSIGAVIGIFVFIAYIPQLSPIWMGQRRNRGNLCLRQYPV